MGDRKDSAVRGIERPSSLCTPGNSTLLCCSVHSASARRRPRTLRLVESGRRQTADRTRVGWASATVSFLFCACLSERDRKRTLSQSGNAGLPPTACAALQVGYACAHILRISVPLGQQQPSMCVSVRVALYARHAVRIHHSTGTSLMTEQNTEPGVFSDHQDANTAVNELASGKIDIKPTRPERKPRNRAW